MFDVDKEEDVEFKALQRRMKGLKVVSRAKVTTDRIYSAAYHPDPSKDLVFFGGKSIILCSTRVPSLTLFL